MGVRRAVIGITGPDRGGLAAWIFTSLAVFIMGGKPVRITPARKFSIEHIDGLIIGGGADIHPDRYGDVSHDLKKEFSKENTRGLNLLSWILFPLLYLFRTLLSTKQFTSHDSDRDELEFTLLEKAVELSLPVLGICRGAQLINIYFGGTLHRDLQEFYVESPQVWTVLPKKTIKIIPHTRLFHALGDHETCVVNALHNQAIEHAGQNVSIVAREPNEVIQAIEHDTLPFVIGVQWHPEYLFIIQDTQRSLFRTFIDSSRIAMKK